MSFIRQAASFAILSAAVVVASLSSSARSAAAASQSVHRPQPLLHGLWVWKSEYISDAIQQHQMLLFCKAHQFNRLLVQVPWEPGSAQSMATVTDSNPAAAATAVPKLQYAAAYQHLVVVAAAGGISVEALDGNPFMGRKEHWAETLATEQALIDFNNTLPAHAKLAGIHWDIEPYTRPDWKSDQRPTIMHEYLDLLTQAKQKLATAAPGMTLAVDIPFWYDKPDESNNGGYDLEFNGVKKNLHEHIQDITDYVGIMSYRRSASGSNGVVALVKADLDYAEKIGKFVCPALETVELDDTPKITFFGQPASAFLAVQQSVIDQLQDRPGFGGMLIHFYPGIKAVLDNTGTTRP